MTEILLTISIIISSLALLGIILLFIFRARGTGGAIDAREIAKLVAKENEKLQAIWEITTKMQTEFMNDVKNSLLSEFRTLNEITSKNTYDHLATLAQSMVAMNQQFTGQRDLLDRKLTEMMNTNQEKLAEMQKTIDQRLFEELDRRLNASFNGMNERLELITKGFGEISEFGRGVDEIKKALGNVKVRGIVGEIQLGILLEQMLAPTQYIKNAQTLKNSQARVDFAIRLPGKDERDILLPIDAKFPLEDYVRLTEAINQNNQAAIKDAEARIEIQIVKQAKEITKYINPPETTDFAIMYIPTEGLFAEILRRPGLTERVHREFKVSITGPSTIAAFLSSLKMGFQTLYVEKRSSEIFKHLAEFNKDFNTFVTTLEKAEKKIGEASGHIGEATNRTRIIQKRLSKLGHGSSDLLETKDPDDYEEQ